MRRFVIVDAVTIAGIKRMPASAVDPVKEKEKQIINNHHLSIALPTIAMHIKLNLMQLVTSAADVKMLMQLVANALLATNRQWIRMPTTKVEGAIRNDANAAEGAALVQQKPLLVAPIPAVTGSTIK